MSTRRAKRHKECTFFDVLDRENAKMNNDGVRFNRFLREVECRPHKFRERAYYREKWLENEALKREYQRYLKGVFKKLGLDKLTIKQEANKYDN